MLKQKQLFRHDPANGIYGDCHRTAIACLLGVDVATVPIFGVVQGEGLTGNQHDETQAWLAERGYTLAIFAYDSDPPEVMRAMHALNPGVHYLLHGLSANNADHTVVALDDHVEWDPAIDNSGIVGRQSDGYTWISIVMPISMKARAP